MTNWILIRNSLLVSGATTVLAVTLGFLAALWVAGLVRPWRQMFLVSGVVSLALPPFLVVNCWLHYFGALGAWRGWLPFDLFSGGGVVLILTLLTWPLTFFWVLSAWSRLDVAHFESDPAMTGRWLVRGLLLPAARSALAPAAVLTFVLALNNFAVPAILQVKVFPAELWVAFNTLLESRALALVGLIWPLVVFPLAALIWLRRREIAWQRITRTVPPGVFRRHLGPVCHGAAGTVAIGTVLLSVALPLTQLGGNESTWAELPPAIAAGKRAIWNSVQFAVVPAVLGVGVGLVTWRLPLGTIVWVPFLLSGVLLGLALIGLLNHKATAFVYQSVAVVFIALTVRYLAVGWHTASQALRSVDRELTDVARLNGASGWSLFRHAHWPQIAPQLAAGGYVTYLLCLWDVETLVLILPPGGETLALRVFNLLHYGHDTHVNALCLILLGLAVLPLAGWGLVNWVSAGIAGRTRRVAPGILALTICAGIGGGCAPSPEGATPLKESRWFSHVVIIGSRGMGIGQFSKPRSLAVDRQDNLYVTDMTGRVQKFAPDGTWLSGWQMPETEKGAPKGMCRDHQGRIVLVEPHYARVNHFEEDGTVGRQWGIEGVEPGMLAFPRAAAVNSHGELYVSEYSLVERVQRFRESGGEFLNAFGTRGRGAGEFNRPEGLGIDSRDRVYVADSCNHRIQVFSREGDFLREYGRPGSGAGELSYPYDVRIDAEGTQFVCEFGNSRIQIFDAEGRSVERIGKPGAAPGEFANPWSLALDSRGNLYVADSMNHRVQKFVRRQPLSAANGSPGGAS